MALIVVAEDDAGTRMLIASVLKKDGHEVLSAEDGGQALALVRPHRPDLVISDVQMPGLNGFEMLGEMRKDPATAAIPVILLTSLQERAHMRIGMTTGADDYITKPFRAAELRHAVDAQLGKHAVRASLQAQAVDTAVNAALVEEKHQLAKLYEQRLAAELSRRWPEAAGTPGDQRLPDATVLFVDIPNYAGMAERLEPSELAELVRRFYGAANDTAHLFGAWYMRFVGEGLLAVFAGETDTRTVDHTLRAARAAAGLLDSARGVQAYLRARYPGRELPPFEPHIALHTGEVTLATLHDPLHDSVPEKLPVGDTVSATMLLQSQGRTLGWPIAASAATARALEGALRTGREAVLNLPGRAAPLEAVEVLGIVAGARS